MSYHGFGQSLPAGITIAPDPVEQPTGDIAQMSTINVNPMLEPGGFESGDQAMMLEMQARSGTQEVMDPGAFQQPSVEPGLTKMVDPIALPTQGPSPLAIPATDEQLLEKLVVFWKSVMAGNPNQSIAPLVEWAMQHGKGEIVARAEMIAHSGGSLPAAMPPTEQTTSPINAQGAPVLAPMATHPVVGTSSPTGPITTYASETGLTPAQPTAPVTVPSPCPPGTKVIKKADGQIYCVPPDYQPVGPITDQGNPTAGPIPQGTPQVGPIPQGNPDVGPIPQGQLPPTTQQYTSTQPSGYVTAPGAAQAKKSNLVPIALAAGAALLLSRLMR